MSLVTEPRSFPTRLAAKSDGIERLRVEEGESGQFVCLGSRCVYPTVEAPFSSL